MNSLLGDRVKFLGFRSDVPAVLSQLDVLVQPNRGPEGLGRSVLEAMACGVPVIAVDKWGPAELVQDGHSGLLFPPLDTEQLAAHMLTLGRDGSLRKTMGTRGQIGFTKPCLKRLGRTIRSDPCRMHCFPSGRRPRHEGTSTGKIL